MTTLDLNDRLANAAPPEALRWLEDAKRTLDAEGESRLDVLFPQFARRMGRESLGGMRHRADGLDVDLSTWRVCDAAGAALILHAEASEKALLDLYLRGDMEERTIVLRTLAILPITPTTVELLGEVQRTNTATHVEAGALDSNLAVRAFDEDGPDAGFTTDDFRRVFLKIAFMDLPIWRMFGALDRADETLAGMLRDYATEREAAGRSTWVDTYRVLGHAPTAGGTARLLGGLEHGDDAVRLAAAEGLRALARPDLAPYLEERLAREPRDLVRRVIESALLR